MVELRQNHSVIEYFIKSYHAELISCIEIWFAAKRKKMRSVI